MKDAYIELAVCGLHMRGYQLNHQLTELNAVYDRKDKTLPFYRMKVIPGDIEKPFLMYHEKGFPIAVEVWRIPAGNLGSFLAGIPIPLGLGKISLQSGDVIGFVGQAGYGEDYKDISVYEGWETYISRQRDE